jgi:hypothetical protein
MAAEISSQQQSEYPGNGIQHEIQYFGQYEKHGQQKYQLYCFKNTMLVKKIFCNFINKL